MFFSDCYDDTIMFSTANLNRSRTNLCKPLDLVMMELNELNTFFLAEPVLNGRPYHVSFSL